MATAFHRETATIYQFPVGGRKNFDKSANGASRRDDDVDTDLHIDYGNWYHNDAIHETDAPRKS